jgi:hypothetical protein
MCNQPGVQSQYSEMNIFSSANSVVQVPSKQATFNWDAEQEPFWLLMFCCMVQSSKSRIQKTFHNMSKQNACVANLVREQNACTSRSEENDLST